MGADNLCGIPYLRPSAPSAVRKVALSKLGLTADFADERR
jgi:hypothetical protein